MKNFPSVGICLKLFVCLLFAAAFFNAALLGAGNPKYVFLFIGDGMGLPYLELADQYSRLSGDGGIFINKFDSAAVTRTSSANSFITDSAAAATAMACGVKTNNGVLGLDASGKRVESCAVAAQRAGRKVGIITSVTINHATPAGFYAHNKKRGNYYQIGLDLIDSKFDFFGGNGFAQADDKKSESYKGNLEELTKQAGYKICNSAAALKALNPSTDKKVFVSYTSYLAIDRPEGEIALADITAKAIELLDNPKGFFMMVEGGKIDYMGHANDAASALGEVFDFDKAINEAFKFMALHPNETLVVVTADHETGGLVLGSGDTFSSASKSGSDKSEYKSAILNLRAQKISQERFAKRLFKMKKEKGDAFRFDDAKTLMEESFGLKFTDDKSDPMRISSEDAKLLERCFEEQVRPANKNSNRFQIMLTRLMAHKAGLSFSTTNHSALPAITWAAGAGADKFAGRIENTDISKILKELMD